MGTSRHADARRRRVITLEDRDFILGAAAWAAKADASALDAGLSRKEAWRRANELLLALRACVADETLIDDGIDILRAACELLTERSVEAASELPAQSVEREGLLGDAERLYDFAFNARWPEPNFGERAEVLVDCALLGWRVARRQATPPVTDEWQTRLLAVAPKIHVHRYQTGKIDRARDAAEIIQQAKPDPITTRFRSGLNDPKVLLPLLDALRKQGPTSPAEVLEESNFLYDFLSNLQPEYPIDAFLLDEREYFLGEIARIAGTMTRELARRDEARRWLDRADGWFLRTDNASGNIAKVGYQRLALRTEERDFAGLPELLPQLTTTFRKLGMSEDALKCRFLEVVALQELDRLPEAKSLLVEMVGEAKGLRNESLLAYAYINLVQVHALLGEANHAIAVAREATPLLRKLDNRVGLAKLYWGVGCMQREQGDISGAIKTLRNGQREFADLAMRADVAAVHLVVADVLLDAGQEKQAESEIRQALPLIDEYKLVPEGFAAMKLLRESLRRQKIDRQALRNLHGYFEELKS